MALLYDDYIWRLTSTSSLAVDLQLPKDLEWIDEFTWSPVQQTVSTTLSGALVIQESRQEKGRPVTLQGFDDMAWVSRLLVDTLIQMRDTAGLVMNLSFIHWNGTVYGDSLYDYQVMFRHYEPPVIQLESVLRFDGFEPSTWFKVRNLKFMETTDAASTPCSANVVLTVSGITGTFVVGEVVTGGTSSTVGTVLGYSAGTLQLYVTTGQFTSGETITGPSGSATVV